MKAGVQSRFALILLVLVLVQLACAGSGAPAETATPSPLPVATNTPTPRPSATPRPTQTPNLAATAKADEFNGLLNGFKEAGYINTASGAIMELEDFNYEWAQLGWFQLFPTSVTAADFVLNAHMKWSTANATPEISGCGIAFGLQENGDYYVVFIDHQRILFLMKRGEFPYTVGKTRGKGTLNLDNPAEADMSLIVNGQTAYVVVNGDMTQYTLSADQTSSGEIALSILSGTNKDYGTRCEMTNMVLWQPRE